MTPENNSALRTNRDKWICWESLGFGPPGLLHYRVQKNHWADLKVNQAERSILSSVLKSPSSIVETAFYLQSNTALLLWRNLLDGVNSQAWQDKPWESKHGIDSKSMKDHREPKFNTKGIQRVQVWGQERPAWVRMAAHSINPQGADPHPGYGWAPVL